MNMKVDLDTLLKQAQEMQSKMQSAQAELAKIVVTGEAGGGLVKIEMDGRHNVKSIDIEPIKELLIGAFNDAVKKTDEASRQKLNDLTNLMQTKFSSDIATTTDE
ncbi:MAG: nucleoid-associated protein Entcl [Pseudomonadota bacterium]|jgi:DNA-binding YbaB/EbfC family protein